MFITINVGASANIKNTSCVQKKYNWNPATCSCKNDK